MFFTFMTPSDGSRLSESCLFLVPLTSAGRTLRYVRSKSSANIKQVKVITSDERHENYKSVSFCILAIQFIKAMKYYHL